MSTLIVASANKGKIQEISSMLKPHGIEVLSLHDIDGNIDKEIIESGSTFTENALIKARHLYKKFHKPTLADDSGLCVDALDGAPGVYSARFAGPQKNDNANNKKLVTELQDRDLTTSKARFHCCMAFIDHTGKEHCVDGTVEGKILLEPRGTQGFGYDPHFFVPTQNATMAELPPQQKNQISHRANALKQIIPIIQNLI